MLISGFRFLEMPQPHVDFTGFFFFYTPFYLTYAITATRVNKVCYIHPSISDHNMLLLMQCCLLYFFYSFFAKFTPENKIPSALVVSAKSNRELRMNDAELWNCTGPWNVLQCALKYKKPSLSRSCDNILLTHSVFDAARLWAPLADVWNLKSSELSLSVIDMMRGSM